MLEVLGYDVFIPDQVDGCETTALPFEEVCNTFWLFRFI